MRLLGVVAFAVIGLALTPACSLLIDTSGLAGGSDERNDASVISEKSPNAPKPEGGGPSTSGTSGGGPSAPPLPCDPNEAPKDGIFASEEGDDAAVGTRVLPVKTITRALALATTAQKSVVYLQEGTYREAVVLSAAHAGMTISAGWRRSASTWTRDCAPDVASRTTLASPDAIGLRVTGAAKEIVVERVTIKTKPSGASTAGEAGESVYGLFVEGSTVRLRGAAIEAGAGGAGGFVPDRAPASNLTCDGTTACSTGAPGAVASQGAPASSMGAFDKTGYVPADGTDGTPGKPGTNGTPGGKSPTPCAACMGASSCLNTNNCMSGPLLNLAGGKGRCGCAGDGGLAGAAGRGGGASIAVFVVGGEVMLDSSTLRTGPGGRGSNGGQGGAGGPGTPGQLAEGTQFCASGCGPTAPIGPGCFCTTKNIPVASGSPGSAGGAGSAGGKGGGGAGGPSYVVVTSGGAHVIRDTKSVLYASAPGKGAEGAADGLSGETSSFE